MSEAIATPEATPEPAPTPEPTSTPPASWREGLDVDLRENPSLTKFEDVGSLAKSYVEVQSLVGKKGIIPPGENATPEQINEFHAALGRPENVEGYDLDSFEVPETLADVWNMNGVNEVAEEAFKLGVTKEQFNGLIAKQAEVQAAQLGERLAQVTGNREATTTTLKEEWGAAFEAKKDQAHRAFNEAAKHVGIDPAELAGSLLPDGGVIGDNPNLMRIFAALGEAGGELPFLGGKGGRMTMTPEEASTELEEIEDNPALYNSSMPGHKQLVDRRDALLQQAFPTTSGDAA
jgi:hypothetical protein